MSLSGGGGVHTAVAEGTLNTGGLSNDRDPFRMQATEDRRIMAVTIAMRGGQDAGGMEVSFSSLAEAIGSQNGNNNAKSPVVAVSRGGNTVHFSDGIDEDWGEGEEVHVHTENNTGSTIRGSITVYYREE